MCYWNNICFVCLSDKDKLNAVYLKETETDNEIFMQVKYTLPELMILTSENPVYICSSCHTTLRSFYTFKKKCLENYSRLNDHVKILQERNNSDQSFSELQIEVIKCEPLINHDDDLYLNTIETNEAPLQSWNEQPDHNIQGDVNIDRKEDPLASKDSSERDFYQKIVKNEPVSDDEQDGAASKHNNTSDKDDTNSNTDTESQEFQCSMCNEVFTNGLTFNTHLRNHLNNITGLECLICNKKFSKMSDVNRHMKFHLGIKDYECSICKKKFTLSQTMTVHMKSHLGIKDYECPICTKKFTQSSILNRHLKIHQGIKDYECSICKKKFAQKSHLKTHMKTHERNL